MQLRGCTLKQRGCQEGCFLWVEKNSPHKFIHNMASTSILDFFFPPKLHNLNDNRVHARKMQKGLKIMLQKSNSMFLLKIMKRNISPNSAEHTLLMEMAVCNPGWFNSKKKQKFYKDLTSLGDNNFPWPAYSGSPKIEHENTDTQPLGSEPCPFIRCWAVV